MIKAEDLDYMGCLELMIVCVKQAKHDIVHYSRRNRDGRLSRSKISELNNACDLLRYLGADELVDKLLAERRRLYGKDY